MRRSDASRLEVIRRLPGIALVIFFMGSAIATAYHTHPRGSEHPQDCAVCHVVHQPVQVAGVVALPEPAAPRSVTSPPQVCSAPDIFRPFQLRLSRAPPA